MSISFVRRAAVVATAVSLGLLGQALAAGPADAVTSTQAQLSNGQLRLEGTSFGGVFVTATSTTSAAGARADQNGRYRIQATNFTSLDCYVTVSDGITPTATVHLSGCTPSAKPVPPVPAPPTGSCEITPQAPVTFTHGTLSTEFFGTTGCDTTTGSGATPTPVQWSLVAGDWPTGMTGVESQGLTHGGISGIPSIPGTYVFTLQVVDQVGATDQENFTIVVQ
jgi:hypothetical protein